MNTPWHIADHDGRISIVGADGSKMTEILPALIHKHWRVDKADKIAIAEHIVHCVNEVQNVPTPAEPSGAGDRGLPSLDHRDLGDLLPDWPNR